MRDPPATPTAAAESGRDAIRSSRPFRLEGFTVDPTARTLTGARGTVQLEPKVMEVLVVLAENAGRVVAREEILQRVWPRASGDEVLSRSIYQLRRHFGEDSRHARYIITVPKRGYRLAVHPQPYDPAPAGVVRALLHGRLWSAAAGTAAILAVGVFLYLYHVPANRDPGVRAGPPPGSQTLAPQRSGPTIAVLPFADLNETPDKSYLANGFAEELLNGLGGFQTLNVIARTSSFAFKESDATPIQIGRELGVDALLTGSVHSDGERIRIATRLLDAGKGRELWSQSYEGTFEDVLAIQDLIARGVVRTLGVEHAGETSDLQLEKTTRNARAYALYLEGQYYAHRGQAGALHQAIAFFEQAIDVDPDFALAYTGLAESRMLQSQFGDMSVADATTHAQPAVDHALALDAALADAYAAQGLIHMYNGRYQDAAKALREAVALNPANAAAHQWLGRAFDLEYRYRQALAVYRRAQRLDPIAPIVNMNVCRMLTLGGRLDEGREYCAIALEHEPELGNLHWALGFNRHLAGDLDAAREHYEAAIGTGIADPWAYAQYAELLLDRGEFDEAHLWLERAEAAGAPGRALVFGRSLLFAARGAFDEMREHALERYAEKPDQVVYLFMAAAAETRRGNHAAALDLYERGRRRPLGRDDLFHIWDIARGDPAGLDLAYAYKRLGDEARFEQTLGEVAAAVDDVLDRGIATPAMHYVNAVLHSLSGAADQAMDELVVAVESGWRGGWRAASDRRLALLHHDLRFQRVVQDGADAPPGRRAEGMLSDDPVAPQSPAWN